MERRWLAPLALGTFFVIVLVILLSSGKGGAGGGGSGADRTAQPATVRAEDPQADTVLYAPGDAAIVAALDTASPAMGESPLSDALDAVAKATGLQALEIDPTDGAALAVWGATARKLSAAFTTADPGSLQDDVDAAASSGELSESGAVEDATAYTTKAGRYVAMRGATLLIAPTRAELGQALVRHDARSGMTQERLDRLAAPLDQTPKPLARILMTPAALNIPEQTSTKVAWLAALQRVSARVTLQGATPHLHVAFVTDPSQVADTDLPIAADVNAPAACATTDTTTATLTIHDLAQAANFATTLAQALPKDPIAALDQDLADLRTNTGIDVTDQILGALTGDATITRDDTASTTTLKAALLDPQSMANALQRLSGQRVGTATITGLGNDTYAVKRDDGTTTLTFGIRKRVLVATTDPEADATTLDDVAKPCDEPGSSLADGALAADADGSTLADMLPKHAPALLRTMLTNSGHLRLTLKASHRAVTADLVMPAP